MRKAARPRATPQMQKGGRDTRACQCAQSQQRLVVLIRHFTLRRYLLRGMISASGTR